MVFYLLVSNLGQLLQAVRLLLLNGFEGQGRAVFRNFVELADLTLAVVAYEDVYRDYITIYNDRQQDYHHWRRFLSPTVVRRRLIKLDAELDIPSIDPIHASDVRELREDIRELREDTYSWFSLFSHVSYVGNVVSTYRAPLGGGVEDVVQLGMLGEAGQMARATFARALLYVWLFFLYLDRLLWEHHRWGRFRGERSRAWYRYRARAFDALFRQNYSKFEGIAQEHRNVATTPPELMFQDF